MDPSAGVFNQSLLDLVVRWVILTALFLALTYFFRDRVMPEGVAGFALSLFILLPANILMGAYLAAVPNLPEAVELPAYLISAFALNFVLLEIFVFLLPGFTVSSQWALLFFDIGLSLASASIRYVPDVAQWVPPGILQ